MKFNEEGYYGETARGKHISFGWYATDQEAWAALKEHNSFDFGGPDWNQSMHVVGLQVCRNGALVKVAA